MKAMFEVLPFCSSKYSDKNTNVLSRILNSFIQALNTKHYLPVYMVVLLDHDLIQYLEYTKFKVASLYGLWIEYLSETLAEALQNRKSSLPKKAKLSEETQVYWVEPVNQGNFDYVDQQTRDKFTHCLEANAKAFEPMRVLKIRDYWDCNDDNLVFNNKLTKAGIAVYWKSLDASFELNVKKRADFLIRSRFWMLKSTKSEDQKQGLIKKSGQEDTDMLQFFGRYKSKDLQNDRFHWSRRHANQNCFMLPGIRKHIN